ncbi:MAG: dihydropteroate synthase [Chloroflexi bacterium]|nr:dihydropteroate synthase [Chloroflexota bacterium]
MGIVNVTPDSFSGDGLGTDVEAAVRQAREMVHAGADVLDVGGESTAYWKTGYQPVTDEEELRRVLPVIERLRAALPSTPISIDTRKPAVARRALGAGATWLNDIEGAWDDGSMADLAAEFGATFVIMYNARERTGRNIVDEVREALSSAAARSLAHGVHGEQIVLDPGFGFGNVPGHEPELVRGLPEIVALAYPVLVGPSRKRFIGRVLGTPENDRVEGTAAVVALAIAAGVAAVRVHDVEPIARVVRMADALTRPA